MAHRIREVVRVMLRAGGVTPESFVWQGRRYRVQHVDAVWKEAGRWWEGEGERTFFRISAATREEHGVYDLALHHDTAVWTLERVLD